MIKKILLGAILLFSTLSFSQYKMVSFSYNSDNSTSYDFTILNANKLMFGAGITPQKNGYVTLGYQLPFGLEVMGSVGVVTNSLVSGTIAYEFVNRFTMEMTVGKDNGVVMYIPSATLRTDSGLMFGVGVDFGEGCGERGVFTLGYVFN